MRRKLRISKTISKLKTLKLKSFLLKMENLKAKINLSQILISTSKIYSTSWVPSVTVTIMTILCKVLLIIWLLRILNLRPSLNPYKKKQLKNCKRWKLIMKVKCKSNCCLNNSQSLSSLPNHYHPHRSLPLWSTSSCWNLNAWVMPSRNYTCSSCWGTRDLWQLYCSEGLNMGGWVKTSTLAVTRRVPPSLYLR